MATINNSLGGSGHNEESRSKSTSPHNQNSSQQQQQQSSPVHQSMPTNPHCSTATTPEPFRSASSLDAGGNRTATHLPKDTLPSEGDDRLFSLKWNEFDKQLTAGFSDLYYSQDFTDVTLCCEGKSAHAHKVVLAMCSPYFREIFKENPCQHPVVIIKGIRFQDLQKILRFIYFGQVSVVKNKIQDFIEAAELIKLDGISSQNIVRRDGEDVKHRMNLNIPSGSSSPAEVSNSSPSISTTTGGNLKYHSHGMLSQGTSPVMRDFSSGSDPSSLKHRIESGGGGMLSERSSARMFESVSPPSLNLSPHSDNRYNPPRLHPHSMGGMNAGMPGDLSCVQPVPVISHGMKKGGFRWGSSVGGPGLGDFQKEPASNMCDALSCPRSSPIDPNNLYISRPLSSDGTGPTRVPSTSSSCGDVELLLDHSQPVKVGSMDDPSQECSRESGMLSNNIGEYELSIRSAESPYAHIKSFTTPSGMVVTSTLHGPGDPSNSQGGVVWPLVPGLKPCTATAASIQTAGKLCPPGFRLPPAPALHYPNGSIIPKLPGIPGLDGHSSQSSVPAKKRFSHVSHRLLGYSEQQINQERFERQHRMQLAKQQQGMSFPFAQGSSPSRIPSTVTSSSGPIAAPRLKSHRQSHVPPSARYTTAEVDALVDSVNDHSGPYVPCKICDKLVKRERLRAHIHECHLVHGEKIICPHCGVGLKSKGSYRVHVWRHRRGVLAKGIKSKWVLSQRPRVSTP